MNKISFKQPSLCKFMGFGTKSGAKAGLAKILLKKINSIASARVSPPPFSRGGK